VNYVTERVTVEYGGFSDGVYHYVRVTDYDVDPEMLEDEAVEAFKREHGSLGWFGNLGAGVESRTVPPARGATEGRWVLEQRWVEVSGYTTKAGIKKRGHLRRAMVRVWEPADPGVTYYKTLHVDTDTKRDTRGGKRRNRWLR